MSFLVSAFLGLASAQVVIPPDPNMQIPQHRQAPLPSNSSSPLVLPPGVQGMPGLGRQPQAPLSEMLGEATLAPPKSIKKLPPLWPYYLAASAFAILLLMGLLIWILKRNRKQKPVPVIPADVKALTGLELLLPLIREAKAREFSYQASEIIRGYIEDRFAVRARNQTTREFLDLSLKANSTISESHRASLKKFLNYCDLAKFAKQMLPPEQLNEMYQSASTFIKETRPSIMATTAANTDEKAKEATAS